MVNIAPPSVANGFLNPHNVEPKQHGPYAAKASHLGDLQDAFCWSWEVQSELSVPSAWSAKTGTHTLKSSKSHNTMTSGASGSEIPLPKIKYVKPLNVPDSGGTVVVGLHAELPQAQWGDMRVMLVAENGTSVQLEPIGIRKGRKLCVKIGPLDPMDYDVRLVFQGRILHGSIPIGVEPSVATPSFGNFSFGEFGK
jgi:hypothetical protein